MPPFLRRAFHDVIRFRNIEAYVLVVVGVGLLIMDVIGPVDLALYLAGMTAALTLLVFRAAQPPGVPVDVNAVLKDRGDYGKFDDFIRDARELWVYGPSAIGVVSHAAAIRQQVLDGGGRVRFMVQNPAETAALAYLAEQLDRDTNVAVDLRHSLDVLARMQRWGSVEVRLLRASPGFSLVIVNPTRENGYLTVEFHGYQTNLVNERMHVVIRKAESRAWFAYWVGVYEAMWADAVAAALDG
jgi:hypothetical protein